MSYSVPPKLTQSRSYRYCKLLSRYLDDYRLDGVLGLIPVVGDVLGQSFNLVYVYVAAVKLRSWRLTLVVLSQGIQDMVIGLIPFAGAILDFFFKANKRNLALIEGFAAGDAEVIRQVNRRALISVLVLVVLLVLAYYLIQLTWWLMMWLWQMLIV